MLIKDAVKLFLRHLGADVVHDMPGRNLESSTISWYKRMLRPMVESFGTMNVEDVSTTMLNNYKKRCGDGVSVSTANARIRAMKAFFNLMVYIGYLRHSPAGRVSQTKIQNSAPKAHSRELVRLIRAASLKVSTRAALAVHLVTITGARASEIACLRWQDVDLEKCRATVRGKGDRARKIFFSQTEVDLFEEYLPLRNGLVAWQQDENPDLKDKGEVFWGRHGPMGYPGMRKDFQKCFDRTDMELTATPIHGCRHAFAKNWLKNGGDLTSLQDVLGHADIATTKMYLLLDDDELAERHEQFAGFD